MNFHLFSSYRFEKFAESTWLRMTSLRTQHLDTQYDIRRILPISSGVRSRIYETEINSISLTVVPCGSWRSYATRANISLRWTGKRDGDSLSVAGAPVARLPQLPQYRISDTLFHERSRIQSRCKRINFLSERCAASPYRRIMWHFFPCPPPSPKQEERNRSCRAGYSVHGFRIPRSRICIVDRCVYELSSERRERARLVTYLMLRLHETTFLLSLPLLTMNVALWTCRLDLIIERRIYRIYTTEGVPSEWRDRHRELCSYSMDNAQNNLPIFL